MENLLLKLARTPGDAFL